MQDRHQIAQQERPTGRDRTLKIGKDAHNRQARRPRAAHGREVAARDTASESDEGEGQRVEFGERRSTPAEPAQALPLGLATASLFHAEKVHGHCLAGSPPRTGVRMSPANPRYVGRGDNTCGVYHTPYGRAPSLMA
jgi:hypothetical protein